MVGLGRSVARARETQRRAEQHPKTQRALAVYHATVQGHVTGSLQGEIDFSHLFCLFTHLNDNILLFLYVLKYI